MFRGVDLSTAEAHFRTVGGSQLTLLPSSPRVKAYEYDGSPGKALLLIAYIILSGHFI
jgi:hypothetical protein